MLEFTLRTVHLLVKYDSEAIGYEVVVRWELSTISIKGASVLMVLRAYENLICLASSLSPTDELIEFRVNIIFGMTTVHLI